MTENNDAKPRRSHKLLVGLVAISVFLAAAIIFGVSQAVSTNSEGPTTDSTSEQSNPDDPTTEEDDDVNNGDEGTGSKSPLTNNVLPEAMNGQEAIDALGDNIEAVAKRNGKTVDELKELLLRDETVYVSKNGFILFRDNPNG